MPGSADEYSVITGNNIRSVLTIDIIRVWHWDQLR